MKTDVRLSTRFLTTQNAHQVGMLVTLAGEMPVRRRLEAGRGWQGIATRSSRRCGGLATAGIGMTR